MKKSFLQNFTFFSLERPKSNIMWYMRDITYFLTLNLEFRKIEKQIYISWVREQINKQLH